MKVVPAMPPASGSSGIGVGVVVGAGVEVGPGAEVGEGVGV